MSLIVKNNILFVGPIAVAKRLIVMCQDEKFWMSVGGSLFRIIFGFLVAFILAYVCAFVSGRFKLFEDLIWPLVSVFKSIPVASVVVLLLIWFGSKWLSVYVSFMVVFPNVYINLMEAVKKTDTAMMDMAETFGLTYIRIWRYIIGESAGPLLSGAVKMSVGMSFKSGVAAEIIGLPDYSIGEQMYMSKIYIDTAGVIALTVVIVLLSYLSEKIIIWIVECIMDASMHCHRSLSPLQGIEVDNVKLSHVCVCFNEQTVLYDFSYEFDKGKCYFIEGDSGKGKTTLLNLIRGNISASFGDVFGINRQAAMVYQEDRLVSCMTAMDNLRLVRTGYSEAEIRNMLDVLIPNVDYEKKISEFSGGMKRRVALLRALISSGQILILDEPFTGLDEENRKTAMEFILKYRNDRTLIITGHDTKALLNQEFIIVRL